jgi:hypothetical protein
LTLQLDLELLMLLPKTNIRRQLSREEEEARMRIHSNHRIWCTALLLLIFAAGCGDPDKGAGAGGVPILGPPAIPLATACGVGILAGSTVTNTATPTSVSGTSGQLADVDVSPGSAITGFPPGTKTGAFHAADATAAQAQLDLTAAYNNAAGKAGGAALVADIGGLTLTPGVYKQSTALGITGNLTLDGGGDPNAAWIFQIGSTLTTAAGNSHVILTNGASAHNVFWQVGSSATLGTNTIFQGTIMAQASITLTTGATLNGRAQARTGAVTLDNNTVVVPSCP